MQSNRSFQEPEYYVKIGEQGTGVQLIIVNDKKTAEEIRDQLKNCGSISIDTDYGKDNKSSHELSSEEELSNEELIEPSNEIERKNYYIELINPKTQQPYSVIQTENINQVSLSLHDNNIKTTVNSAEISIIRIYPEAYDSIFPGQALLNEIMKRDENHQDEIKFCSKSQFATEMKTVSQQLTAMKMPNEMHVEGHACTIVLTDKKNMNHDINKINLNKSKAFSNLPHYYALRYLENACKEILNNFVDQYFTYYCNVHPSSDEKFQTRSAMKIILENQYSSYQLKLEKIIYIIEHRNKTLMSDRASDVFFADVKKLNLGEDLTKIKKTAREIQNRLLSRQISTEKKQEMQAAPLPPQSQSVNAQEIANAKSNLRKVDNRNPLFPVSSSSDDLFLKELKQGLAKHPKTPISDNIGSQAILEKAMESELETKLKARREKNETENEKKQDEDKKKNFSAVPVASHPSALYSTEVKTSPRQDNSVTTIANKPGLNQSPRSS